MLDWFIQNKEWLFSGVAISAPIALAGWILSKRSKKLKEGNHISTVQYTQGDKSPVVNTKGNVEIHYDE